MCETKGPAALALMSSHVGHFIFYVCAYASVGCKLTPYGNYFFFFDFFAFACFKLYDSILSVGGQKNTTQMHQHSL